MEKKNQSIDKNSQIDLEMTHMINQQERTLKVITTILKKEE